MTFARMMLTHVNVKIHSAVRYRPLVVNIAFHEPPLSSICCHSNFEILQLMYRSCPGAKDARSQGDGVMVNLYWYSWLLCTESTQITS